MPVYDNCFEPASTTLGTAVSDAQQSLKTSVIFERCAATDLSEGV